MREMRSLLKPRVALSSLREMNPSFQSLRALSLKRFAKSTLPDCIGRLRRLRYLNLKNSRLKCLPNFIVELVCLQTLNLDQCYNLKRWPRGFSNLANLRHLRFQGCKFHDMPSGFGKMKSLVEVNKFIVGNVSGLDTLAALDLKGYYVEIDFYKCRRNSVVETRRVNMKDNHRLRLYFSTGKVTPKSGNTELLLECLILPPSLEYLKIYSYSGERFPTWMLPNLVTVEIQKCESCVQLPQFSQLPSLKSLTLNDLEALEYIEEDGWGGDGESCSAIHFVALEKLYINEMPKLKGWFWRPRVKDYVHPQQADMTSDVHQDLTSHRLLSFPRLSQLYIGDCPQFVSMPLTLLPRLDEFYAENIHEKAVESLLASHREAPSSSFPSSSSSSPTLSTLKKLHIEEVNIVSFSINSCDSETLEIKDCEKLTSLIVVSPNSPIRQLDLRNLKNLRALPEEIDHLAQLRDLTICYCPELASLPQSFCGLSSLQSLRVFRCPHLETRCRKPDGEDWPLIQHIPNIRLY
ncbi:hypothetical protein BVRB_7g158960 [Beta vulgaris subsp. vulgaris]|nr:hypothetical protein BVRB_7g158960 [Beta vulgaris subsp. vulgaris]